MQCKSNASLWVQWTTLKHSNNKQVKFDMMKTIMHTMYMYQLASLIIQIRF